MCEVDDGKAKPVASYSIAFMFKAVCKQIAFPLCTLHILRVSVIRVIKRLVKKSDCFE